jgi:hypothetical protein
MDAELVQRTLSHIQEHINILSDPNVANILMLLGEQPIQPPMPPQQPMPQESAPLTQDQAAAGADVGQIQANPQAESVQASSGGQLPNPASPPSVQGAQGPVEQPQTPEQLFQNNT